MPPERIAGLAVPSALTDPSVEQDRTHGKQCPAPAVLTRSVPRARLYAALDLGTNSCRMLIARPRGNHFEVIDSFARPIALGLGLELSGRLGPVQMARAVQALRVCRRKLDDHQVQRMRLVATEACRRAQNARDFLGKVRRETGLKLEVISPAEEAELAVVACAPLVAETSEQILVVDIGGGSTELVWLDLTQVPPKRRRSALMDVRLQESQRQDGGAANNVRVVDWISVPFGVATLHETFLEVTDQAARFALMSWYFEEQLQAFKPYAEPAPKRGFQIIGTSGTVTTVAAAHLGLKRYDRSKVDGLVMTSEQIDRVIRAFFSKNRTSEKARSDLGFTLRNERSELILSGAAILQAVMRVWPSDMISVADRGVREGLLYTLMRRDGVLTGPVQG